MRQHLTQLPPGDWVVRLRAPVDAREFASAASPVLKSTLRGELSRLFGAAVAMRLP